MIATATDLDGARPFGQLIDNYLEAQQRGEPVGQPPLKETVYLETYTDDGLTIAAGNRVTTFWRLQLLLSGGNPVSGSFGSAGTHGNRWPKNVWNLNSALGSAVRSVGGKTLKWPSEF